MHRALRDGRIVGALLTLLLSFPSFVWAQVRPYPEGPLIKLIGFFNATPPKGASSDVLTLKLPHDEKRYTFVLKDMKIMAGPLRTPGDILAEVKPYSTNFYLRTSREIAERLANASPAEPVSILAQYSSADRALLVQNVETNAEARPGGPK
jgi:hypothetical protein